VGLARRLAVPSVRSNDVHEAMFPAELPRRLIKLLSEPGDVILDCFMGSGTTARAAVELGRR
jgi:site-specific DNA-methyltransferase (adenine-specific)